MTQTVQNIHGILGIPRDDIFSLDNIRPQEAAATNSTTYSFFPESNLEWDVSPNANNYTNANGEYSGKLLASGIPANNRESLDVSIVQGGFPDQTATFKTMYPTYVFDNINVPIDFQIAGPGSSSLSTNITLAACVLNSNETFVFPPGGTYYFQTVNQKTWNSDSTGSSHSTFNVIKLPDDTFILIALSVNSFLIKVSENATSWTEVSRVVLDGSLYNKPILAYDPLTKILTAVVLDTTADQALCYQSSDMGASWVLFDLIDNVSDHRMVSVSDTLLYAYLDLTTDVLHFKQRVGGGTFIDIFNTITSFSRTSGSLALTVYPNNWVIAIGRDTSNQYLKINISTDLGKTWGDLTSTYPYVNGSGTSNRVLDEGGTSEMVILSACVVNYSLRLFGFIQPNGNYYVGNINLGQIRSNSVIFETSFGTTYIPSNLPTSNGWSLGAGSTAANGTILDTSVGTGTRIYSGPLLNISTSASHCYYTKSNVFSVANSSTVKFAMRPISGGSTTADNIFILMNFLGTGSNYCSLKLRFSTTQVVVIDAVSGVSKGTFNLLSTTELLEFKIGNGKVSALNVYIQSRIYGDQNWTTVTSDDLTGTATVKNSIEFGNFLSSNGSSSSQWTFLTSGVFASWTGDDLPNYPLCTKIPLCSKPTSIYTPSSLNIKIGGKSGPFKEGDDYDITYFSRTSMHRGISSVLYNSPRQSYIATVTPNTLYYAVFDAGTNYYGRLGDTIGLALLGSNAELVNIDGWSGAAWVNIASISPFEQSLGTSNAWVRSNTSDKFFRPNGTNGNPRYFRENQLAGCIISISDNAGNVVVDTCVSNTSGQFSNATGVKSLLFQLSGTPLSGTYAGLATSTVSGSPGTISVMWPDVLSIGLATASVSRYYRITFRSNDWETELRIGKIIPFTAMFIPKQQSVGGQITYQANDEITSLPYGFQRGRKLAPSSRIVRAPWRQLLLNQNRYAGGTAINTVGPGSFARSVQDDNLDKLQSMIETTGTSKPVIWAPEVYFTGDPATTGPTQIYGKDAFLWGNIQGDITATIGHGMRYATNSSIKGYHTVDTELVFKEIV